VTYGSTGSTLRVDLTRGETSVETFDEDFYRTYPGGKALGAYYVLRESRPGADPLGPDNPLVLAVGLLAGAPFSAAARFSAIARSPLTGGFGESEAGGYWGPELRSAGFDAVIITGAAAQPSYLWVRDGQAELRDARHLWGETPPMVQAAIRDEVGESLARVLQVGPGGERLVRYAILMNELRHYNGRTGMGAVMGSKNLRAIAVRGSGRYASLAHDPAAMSQLGKRVAKQLPDHPQGWDLRRRGTTITTDLANASGFMPTRNFHQGSFEGIDAIGGEAYDRELRSGSRTCYACAVRCKPQVKVADRYVVSETYDGPEYETVAGFGANCALGDIQAVAKANERCNELGIDTISTSGAIAFAMECFEHGLIGTSDTDGLDLRFGNVEATLALIERIGRREGFGALLADGVRRAAAVIGGGADAYAIEVKGMELPLHDPRAKFGLALGFATNEAGPDHCAGYHDPLFAKADAVPFRAMAPLGISEPVGVHDLGDAKVRNWYITERWSAFQRVAGLCYFGTAPRSFIQVDEVLEAVHAATGWDLDPADLLAIGDRAINLSRMFNVREGFSRADDRLPDRLFTPLENGLHAGVALPRDDFERALTRLYELKGWNPDNGIPSPGRLRQLGIGWFGDVGPIDRSDNGRRRGREDRPAASADRRAGM
jgi:aldehyde:ferredoxin oxidoreductase